MNSLSLVNILLFFTTSPNFCTLATVTRHAPDEPSSTFSDCRSEEVRFLCVCVCVCMCVVWYVCVCVCVCMCVVWYVWCVCWVQYNVTLLPSRIWLSYKGKGGKERGREYLFTPNNAHFVMLKLWQRYNWDGISNNLSSPLPD